LRRDHRIGISIILQHLALLVWSRNPLAFPQIIPLVSFHVGGAIITGWQNSPSS